MPIDRTAYNLLVDDDGTNTTGSVWNKTAIKDVLLDPIDAAIITAGAPLNSPAFTGVPTAPTAAADTNTTQIATTAYVQGEFVSPALSGTPTAPTAAVGTNTTQIATCAFVLAQGATPIVQTTTLTGTQNDFTLTTNVTTLRVNNASLVTFTGFAAGADGQRVQIVSVGAGQVDINHQSASSSAANRVINPVTATISLAAGSGGCLLQYDASATRWRIVQHLQGAGLTRTFNAANYTTGSAMLWTVASGGVTTERWMLVGRFVTFSFYISGTIGGTLNTTVLIAIPGGFTSANTASFQVLTTPASGTQQAGVAYVTAGGTLVNIALNVSGTGNWTAGTGIVNGTIMFEVQ